MFNIHILLILIIVLVLLLVIITLIKVLLKHKSQRDQTFPYEKQSALFSPSERSFLGVLEQAISNRYRLMGKTRLADIVKVKSGLSKSAWQNAFNKIQGKHIDIVACDPANLSVLFAIELDDKTHRQSKRQTRDHFVDNVLRAAGIPIVHFIAKNSYSFQEIESILSQAGVLLKSQIVEQGAQADRSANDATPV